MARMEEKAKSKREKKAEKLRQKILAKQERQRQLENGEVQQTAFEKLMEKNPFKMKECQTCLLTRFLIL